MKTAVLDSFKRSVLSKVSQFYDSKMYVKFLYSAFSFACAQEINFVKVNSLVKQIIIL